MTSYILSDVNFQMANNFVINKRCVGGELNPELTNGKSYVLPITPPTHLFNINEVKEKSRKNESGSVET